MPRSIIEDIQGLQGLLGVGRAGRMQQLQEREQTAKVGQAEQLLQNLQQMSPEQLKLLKQQVEAGGINNQFLPQEKQAGLESTRAGTRNVESRTAGQDIANWFEPLMKQSQLFSDEMGRGLTLAQTGNVNATAENTKQGTRIEGEASEFGKQKFDGAPNAQMVNAMLQNQEMANRMQMEQERLNQQRQSELLNFGALNPTALGMEYGKPDSGIKAAFERYFPKVQGPPAPARSPEAQRLLDVVTGKAQQVSGPKVQTNTGPAGISDLVKQPQGTRAPTGGSFLGGWEYGKPEIPTQANIDQYSPMGNPPALPQSETPPKTLADRVEQLKRNKILPKVEQMKNRPLLKIGPQQ